MKDNTREELFEYANQDLDVLLLDSEMDEICRIVLKNKLPLLFEKIKHGDETHQNWLKQEIDNFILDS